MNITVESLQNNQNINDIKYQDLKLDLQFDYTRNNEFLKKNEVKDVKVSLNLDAIRNSLFNLFNTNKGEKLLNPYFGLSLTQYLFEPLSKSVAEQIGTDIATGIKLFEPRVILSQPVGINIDYDSNQYDITIIVDIPQINANDISFNGVLNTRGFIFAK